MKIQHRQRNSLLSSSCMATTAVMLALVPAPALADGCNLIGNLTCYLTTVGTVGTPAPGSGSDPVFDNSNGHPGGPGGPGGDVNLVVGFSPVLTDYLELLLSPITAVSTGGAGAQGSNATQGGIDKTGGTGGLGGMAGDVTVSVGTDVTAHSQDTEAGLGAIAIVSIGGAGGAAGKGNMSGTDGDAGIGGAAGKVSATLDGIGAADVYRSVNIASIGGAGGRGRDYGTGLNSNGADGNTGGAGNDVNASFLNVGNSAANGFTGGFGVLVQSVGGAGGGGGTAEDVDGAEGGNGGDGGVAGDVTVTVASNVRMVQTQNSDGALTVQSIGGAGAGGSSTGGSGGSAGAGGNAGNVSILFTGAASPLGTIAANGTYAPGVLAQSLGGNGGDGGVAPKYVIGPNGGSGSDGGTAGTVTISGTGLNVRTGIYVDPVDFEGSVGVLAQSIGGGGGSGGAEKGVFSVGGNGGNGVNGNAVIVTLQSAILTYGFSSDGLAAQSIGGGGGKGGDASGTSVGINMVVGGTAGGGGNGSNVNLTSVAGSHIETNGAHSSGILVQSIGGGGGSGGSAYSKDYSAGFGSSMSLGGTGGNGGNGGNIGFATGQTTTNAGRVSTIGSDSYGMLVQSIGGGGGNGGASTAKAKVYAAEDVSISLTMAMGGNGGQGGAGGVFNAGNAGLIATSGAGAVGIMAQTVGGGGGTGGDSSSASTAAKGEYSFAASFAMGGKGAFGGNGGTGTITNSGFIITTGESADGMLVQSIGGGGGSGGSGDSKATSSGSNDLSLQASIGGSAAGGGDGYSVTATNSGSIITLGDGAIGVGAQSIGGGGGRGGGAAGSTSGDFSASLKIGGNGGGGGNTYHTDGNGNESTFVTVNNLAGSTIVTFGADATGIHAQSIGGGGGNAGKASTNLGTGKSTGDGGNGSSAAAITLSELASGFDANGNSGLSAYLGLNGAIHAANSLLGNTSSLLRVGDDDPEDALDDLSQSKGDTDDDNESTSISLNVALGGSAGSGGSAGGVNVTNAGEVATLGHMADAILAQAIGGGGGKGGAASTATSDDYSGNLAVGGSGGSGGYGGQVTIVNSGSIYTKGSMANGIVGQSISEGGGVGGASTTSVSTKSKNSGDDDANDGGFKSISLSVGGNGGAGSESGQVRITSSGAISTTAHDAIGIIAQSVSGGGGMIKSLATDLEGAGGSASSKGTDYDIQFKFGGAGGTGGLSGLVNVTTLAGGAIVTRGDNSYGILAQSIAGGGGLQQGGKPVGSKASDFFGSGAKNGNVNNDGVNAPGSGNSGLFVTTNDNITTSGAGAIGIFAQSIGGGGGIAGDTGWTQQMMGFTPGGTHQSGNGGVIVVAVNAGSTISTSGTNAPAIMLQSIGGGGGRVANKNGAFMGTAGGSGSGGTINAVIDGTVNATGYSSLGVFAQSQGDAGSNAPITITVGTTGAINVGTNGVQTGFNGTSAGIYVDHGGLDAAHANVITNNGKVLTYGTQSNSIAVYSVAGYTQVINNGTMAGDVLLTNGGGTGCFTNNGSFVAGNAVTVGACGVSNTGTIEIGRTSAHATLTISGNYRGSGALVVDADFAGKASDVVMVSGDAVVGDTITVRAATISNHSLNILSAGGNLTLAPAIATTDSSHLYDFKAARVGQALSIIPVANFITKASALGANEKAVAANLQSLFDGGASADTAFNRLFLVANDAGYAAGLHSLAGQGLGAFGAFRFNSSRTFAANLYGGCDGLKFDTRQADRCGWARVLVNGTTQQAAADTLGYNANAVAMQAGLVTPLSDTLALTGSVAYESSKFRDDAQTARITGDSVVGGVGLLYTQDRLELSAGIDAAYGWYKSSRSITLALTEEAKARPKQSQLGGHVRAAYTLLPGGTTFVRPFVEGHAIHVLNKAFTETGPSPFRLAVEGRSDTALIGVAGLEIGTLVPLSGKVMLRPFASAAIEYGSPRDWTTTARFADQPQGNSFDLKTAGPGTLGRFSVGADLIGSRNVAFSVQYAPEFGKDFTSHAGTARLTIAF